MAYNPFYEPESPAGMVCNPSMDEDARDAKVKEFGMLTVEQPRLGFIPKERVVEHSVPQLKVQVSFEYD